MKFPGNVRRSGIMAHKNPVPLNQDNLIQMIASEEMCWEKSLSDKQNGLTVL